MTTKDDVERAALIERLRSVASYFDHKALPVAFMDGTRYSDFLGRHADALALPPQVSVTEAMVEQAAQIITPGAWWIGEPPNSHQQRRVDLAKEKARAVFALSAVPAGGDGR